MGNRRLLSGCVPVFVLVINAILALDEYTASLTTICTPHYGCRFVDYACRLPEGMYRFVVKCFDRVFSQIGDRNPDFVSELVNKGF